MGRWNTGLCRFADGKLLLRSVALFCVLFIAGCLQASDNKVQEPRIAELSVKSLSSGPRHVCAVIEDGVVQCWGANDHRQLGHDAMPVANAPRIVEGIPPMVEVSVGSQHSCARTQGGDVYCWGGRHGLAKRVKSLSGVKTMASGGARTCVIDSSGTKCFRYDRISLAMLTIGGMEDVVSVSVGHQHVCGVTGPGKVLCWGENVFGQLGDRTQLHRAIPVYVAGDFRAVEVSCGHSHTCARTQRGRAYCWGSNAAGQVGRSGGGALSEPQLIASLNGVEEVVAGDVFSCARLQDGSVSCWGATQRGHFSTAEQGDPASTKLVGKLSGMTLLAAGHAHACGRKDDGTVHCWGDNEHGQLGTGPVQFRPLAYTVKKPKKIAELVAGSSHTCARTQDGDVKCWGLNANWQLGNKSDDTRVPVPIKARDIQNAVQVTAGANHSCALIDGGTVACWGANGRGQIGDKSRERRTRSRPTPKLQSIVHVEAGRSHTCALSSGGHVSCWGDNRYGQLGDGSRNLRTRPVRVRGLGDAIAIATGEKHSCALRRDGHVMCWGSNEQGALGIKRGRFRPSAVMVEGLDSVVELRARGERTCARTASGDILCWGDGKRKPKLVGSYPKAVELDLGIAHMCLRFDDGSVRCSGSNYRGQLGDGTRTLRGGFVPVIGIKPSAKVTCGRRFTCSLSSGLSSTCVNFSNKGSNF